MDTIETPSPIPASPSPAMQQHLRSIVLALYLLFIGGIFTGMLSTIL